jgi:hypothetical protein
MDLKNLFSRVIDLARSAITGTQAPEEREPPAEREQQALDDETRRRTAAGDLETPSMGEDVQVTVERGSTLAIRWNVTTLGVDRARMVLGEEGTLAVRVVIITRGDTDITSIPVEHTPVPITGQTWLDEVTPGALCVAAVGLRSGDRFVSITHADPVRIG